MLLALLLWSPNLLWQVQQGFPIVEHMTALGERQLDHVEPGPFLLVQLLVNLYGAPVWICGLWWVLATEAGSRYRVLGWMYMSNLALMLVLGGKIYYLAPTYPMLLAAGAVAFEAILLRRQARRWLIALPAIVAVGSASSLPIAVPLLSAQDMIAYGQFGAKWLGMGEAMP